MLPNSSSPFFIVGASRSGTTMLRLMLNAHSRLAVPDELKYFRHLDGTDSLSTWQAERDEAAYGRFVRGYLAHYGSLFPMASDVLEAMVMAAPERTLRGPYRVLLEVWAAHHGKARWGEKTPHNIFYVDVLAAMFPGARFLHVVRDPRAAVQSMNTIGYYSTDTVFNALNWRMAIRDGERLFRTCLHPGQYQTVRYEDLVRRPEETLGSVCRFLGEAFEPGMLRFHETANRYMAHRIRTPSITAPVHRDSLEKWRGRLRPSEISIIETLCRAEMDRFGYEGETRRWTGFLSGILPKMLYWRWKVWQHRARRGYEVEYPFLSGVRSRARRWLAFVRRQFAR